MKHILLITLFLSTQLNAADKIISSTGNLILKSGVSGTVQVPGELRANNVATISGGTPPGMVPIGGMVAVMPATHASAWQPPTTGVIKDGFMRADGHTITAQNVTDGSLFPAGTALPSMVAKYPRGSATSGATGGANTVTLAAANIPQLSGSFTSGNMSSNASHTHTDLGHTHGYSETLALDNGTYSSGYDIVANSYLASTTSSGVANIQQTNTDHTHTTAVTLGSASPTATNNEPAYTEVVWVIRVK